MIDHSVQSVKNEYNREIQSLFDEITQMYDKSNQITFNELLEENDTLHMMTKETIVLINEKFSIPYQLLVNDYELEVVRKRNLGIELNDIPTYQLSFALEEGSWIAFLRHYYSNSLIHKYDKLHNLEELLWESGKGQTEDYAYYLIELSQISEFFVQSVFQIWKKSHLEGSAKVISLRMIAGVYNVSMENAQALFNGAVRVLKAKMKDLVKIENIISTSPWAVDSKETLHKLHDQINEGNFDESIISLITTVTLYQREILLRRQERNKKEKNELLKPGGSISEILDWDDLDPLDVDKTQEFKEGVLNMLFNQPHEDPLEAALSLLILIFDDLHVKSKYGKDLLDQFQEKIDERLQEVVGDEEKIRIKVELIQLFLPNILLRLKSDTTAFESINPFEEEVKSDGYWDSFEDSIMRTKRITEDEIYKTNIRNIIKDTYRNLLEKRIGTINIIEIILDNFADRFKTFDVDKPRQSIKEKFEDWTLQQLSHAEIDGLMIDLISDQVTNHFRPNSSPTS